MIIKGKNVLGLKVITVQDGKELETIKDILFDPNTNRVRGFSISTGGWFSDAKILPIENVKSIGPDAVIIESVDSIKNGSDIIEKLKNIAEDGQDLTKTKVITESGVELGRITDLFFESTTGEVDEFEVSQGLIKNAKSGKKRFKINDIVTVGEEATIVSSFTEIMIEEQEQNNPGGLQGILEQGKEKAKDAIGVVKEKATEIKDKTEEKAVEAKDKAVEMANKPEVQEKKDAITEKFQEVKSDIQSGKAKDAVVEKATDAKNTVSEKYEEVKDQATEKKDEIKGDINDQRAQDSIGKYLKTNILDDQDNIIARRGEIITNEILNKAYAARVVKNILDNTSERPIN